MPKFKFELGDYVYHKNIGFRGEITGRAEYIGGAKKYGISLHGSDHTYAQRQPYRWIAERLLTLDKEK